MRYDAKVTIILDDGTVIPGVNIDDKPADTGDSNQNPAPAPAPAPAVIAPAPAPAAPATEPITILLRFPGLYVLRTVTSVFAAVG